MSDFISMLLAVCVFLGLAFAVNVYGSYQCSNYAEVVGKKTKWMTLDTCYVQTKDGWQRWDEYKMRAAASEGLKR